MSAWEPRTYSLNVSHLFSKSGDLGGSKQPKVLSGVGGKRPRQSLVPVFRACGSQSIPGTRDSETSDSTVELAEEDIGRVQVMGQNANSP